MCPPTSHLLGPPAIRRTAPAPAAALLAQLTYEPGNPLVDLMDADFNPSSKGRMENNSLTFNSTGNPCLDFFFHVVPNTPPNIVVALLSTAWAQDGLTALKLAFQLRGIRGAGKSDKEGFYSSALWLHRHHPKTLALNIASFAEFGYVKDLLEILYRLINGPDTRKIAKEQHLQAKIAGKHSWRCHSGS